MRETDKELQFRKLMSHSLVKLPFPDFEDQVMARIQEEAELSRTRTFNTKLSWIFFLAGAMFGIVLMILLPVILPPLPGLTPDTLARIVQVSVLLIVMIQFESLLRATRRHRLKAHG